MGGYAFFIPNTDIELPRLDLISRHSFPGANLLYLFLAAPLHVLGYTVPGVADWVFFGGEGIVTVRPFMIFVFWFVVGVALLLRACYLAADGLRSTRIEQEDQ